MTLNTANSPPQVDPTPVLESVIEPVLADLGYELLLLEFASSGRRTLRLFIDRPGGVNIDDCARVSRIVGGALEAAESENPIVARTLGGRHDLEVSSPGIERPLARRPHFEAQLGRPVTIRLHAPLDSATGQRTFHGRIAEVEADPAHPDDFRTGTITLDEKDSHRRVRIDLPQIHRANLVFEG
jgi:ribosome maturation factor RimP